MRFTAIIFTALLLACSNAKLQDSDSKHQSETAAAGKDSNKDAEAQKQDDESIVPPAQIAGAALRCAEEVPPGADQADTLYGCRITDQSGQRQAIDPVAYPYRFGWKSKGSFAANVVAKSLANDSRYDALFYMRAVDRVALASSIANFEVVLQGQAKDGNYHDAVVNDLNAITVPVSSIPEMASSDYSAIKTGLSAEADAGNPTPPLP